MKENDFPRLERNPITGQYKTFFSLDDAQVEVVLEGPDEINKARQRIAAFLQTFFPRLETFLSFVTDELLETKNTVWLKKEEPKLDFSQFKKNLRLKRVHIFHDETVLLQFTDKGMFWGHSVILFLFADGTPKYATIEG